MRINRNHPWLAGCKFFAFPDGSGAMKNLMGGTEGSVANAPALTHLGGHPALQLVQGSSQATTFGTPASYGFVGPSITVLTRARPDNYGTTNSECAAVSAHEAASAKGYLLQFSNFGAPEVGWVFVVYVGGTFLQANDGTGVATLGVERVVAGRYDEVTKTCDVFIDGNHGGSAANASAWDVLPNAAIILGGFSSPSIFFDGAQSWVMIFDRALSDGEIARLSRDWEWPFFDDDGGELFLTTGQVTYRNTVGIADAFTVLSPVTYSTALDALGAFGGDVVVNPAPSGPATYRNVVGVSDRYIAGVPTLVFYTNVVGVASSFTANSPVFYSNTIHVRDRFVGLLDGRLDLIADTRYRR